MNILVTGGAGFLGLHLAPFLSQKGHNITLADLRGFEENEPAGQARLVLADVRNRQKIFRLMENQEAVIHAAASLPLCSKKEIFETNVQGTKNVLEAAKKNNVRRFIFISSTAVYGIPEKHPIFENDSLIGVGPYGESKIVAEKLCFEEIKKGFPLTVLRPKTFVGQGRLGVFEILFDWIYSGKRIPVIGKGLNRYQLLDVDDLVEAIYLFTLKDKKEYNDVFNLGALEFGRVKEDLEALFAFASSGSKILPTPAFLVKKALRLLEKLKISPLYQWIYDTADKDSFVSIDKICQTLSWQPKYSNSQALIKAYRWYLEHYREIKRRKPGLTHTAGWNQGILGVFKKFL